MPVPETGALKTIFCPAYAIGMGCWCHGLTERIGLGPMENNPVETSISVDFHAFTRHRKGKPSVKPVHELLDTVTFDHRITIPEIWCSMAIARSRLPAAFWP
ncbi:hypothetical protein [Polaromonas sp. CG_9.11]|uniref:hypothetical protein n=1 Tax=Polaromonas sp. CG_9.11 TaxID=2787730 RepID=UPI0018C9FFBA|nr:hypothetical protein [Polaromonas sp. CG_9.11]